MEAVTEATLEYVREFYASMPASYRALYDETAAKRHARIARDRAGTAAKVGLLDASQGAQAVLCVVAEDRPGLLATISAALVLSDFDVMDAEAHTRKTPVGIAEAVDLFWIRRAEPERRGESIRSEEAASFEQLLLDLLEGKLDLKQARERGTVPPAGGETVVRFLEDADGQLSTLEVETSDRSGLLLALSQALFEQKVTIDESEVKTFEGKVRDRFHIVELSGAPISPERRREIQVAVIGALELPRNPS